MSFDDIKQFIVQNLLLVVAVVVTLVALAAVYVPAGMFAEAEANMQAVQKRLREVESASRNHESPRWITASERNIAAIQGIQEKVIEKALIFCNRPPMLVDGTVAFPNPERQQRFSVWTDYRDSFKTWAEQMNATTAPTPAEIEKAVQEEQARMLDLQPFVSGVRVALTSEQTQQIASRVRAKLIRERASGGLIYCDETVFDNALPPTTGLETLAIDKMWEVQLNWWVQNDIVQAIVAANNRPIERMIEGGVVTGLKPRNVREAPVKQLVDVQVNEQYYTGGAFNSGGPGATSANALLPMTEHTTNSRFHVIHYEFQVVIDSMDLALLQSALTRQNFHTVLSVRYQPLSALPKVGNTQPGQGGDGPLVDYGGDAVLLVTYKCEAVFMLSPESWRQGADVEAGKQKRREFFMDHPEMVLKLKQGPRDLELPDEPAARQAFVKEQIKARPDLTIIALYEDLIPSGIARTLPGLGPADRDNNN